MLCRLALLLPLCSACTTRDPAVDTDTTAASTSTSTSTTTDTRPTTSAATDEPTPTTAGPVCEDYTTRILIPLVAAQIMLVLDNSPAMLDPWDHDGDPQTPEQPRWASVRAALLAVLPAQNDLTLDLGLASFPTADAEDSDDAAACRVTPALIVPTSDTPPADVLAALPPANPPPGSFVGGAPIRQAIVEALPQIAEPPGSPRAIFVLANSAPNCDPNAPDLLEALDSGAVDAAASAAAAGVRVFVFGIGASTTPNPPQADHRPDTVTVDLELAALAGAGQGFYVNVASEAALISQLASMFEVEGSTCIIAVDPAPAPDQAVAGVRVDGDEVPRIKDCAAESGWHPLDGGTSIELCGAACTQFKTSGDAEILVACV